MTERRLVLEQALGPLGHLHAQGLVSDEFFLEHAYEDVPSRIYDFDAEEQG